MKGKHRETGRVDLLLAIVRRQMGSLGTILISTAMTLACLTTAIGLTSTFADFLLVLRRIASPIRFGVFFL